MRETDRFDEACAFFGELLGWPVTHEWDDGPQERGRIFGFGDSARIELIEVAPGDAIPDALILQTSTVAGDVEGDAVAVHCVYVDDADAGFVPEGQTISEATPNLAQCTVFTGKIAQLVRLSREQYSHVNTSEQLSVSVSRAVTRAANAAQALATKAAAAARQSRDAANSAATHAENAAKAADDAAAHAGQAAKAADQAQRSGYMAVFRSEGAGEDMWLGRGVAGLRELYAAAGLTPEESEPCVEAFSDRAAVTAFLTWYRAGDPADPDARPVRVPTLYVWSTGDPALGREAAEWTRDYVECAYRFEILDGIDHWIPEHAADVVNERLLAHLAKHPV